MGGRQEVMREVWKMGVCSLLGRVAAALSCVDTVHTVIHTPSPPPCVHTSQVLASEKASLEVSLERSRRQLMDSDAKVWGERGGGAGQVWGSVSGGGAGRR